LREALSRFPHVTALFRHELLSFAQSSVGVSLRARDANGDAVNITCDYLVACDGASSLVRRQLGIGMSGSTFSERWLIVDLENSPSASPHTKVFSNPQRPCIALPGPHDTRRYEFMILGHERDEDLLAPDKVRQLLETHEAAPESRIVRSVVYTFHARLADRWGQGRIFLAGDAAHLMPPFAGQGMNSGLRDANNLAWKLVAVTRRQLGPSLLASYEPERRDHAGAMIEFALKMGRVLAPSTARAAFMTECGFRALALIPGARDYIAQMKFKPPPRFEHGFIVPDWAGSRRTLVGRLFPQPRVTTPDGGEVLLDDALGPGFAILVHSSRAGGVMPALASAPWNKLDAGCFILASGRDDLPAGIPALRMIGKVDRRLARFADHVIVLRPDRYVAACIPIHELADGAAALGNLIQSTFAAPAKLTPRR
jgi:3-(3-hydroxy-phenyl)propionate hydroxylase